MSARAQKSAARRAASGASSKIATPRSIAAKGAEAVTLTSSPFSVKPGLTGSMAPPAHSWSGQQLGLLRRELLLGEDALGFQLPQLLQLVDGRAGGRGGGRCRRGLLGLLLFFLRGPALALTAGGAGGGGRWGAGGGGGGGAAPEEVPGPWGAPQA